MTFQWTDEVVERAKKMIEEGKSFSFIAESIGNPSRNSVIGKLHRLGICSQHKSPKTRIDRDRISAARMDRKRKDEGSRSLSGSRSSGIKFGIDRKRREVMGEAPPRLNPKRFKAREAAEVMPLHIGVLDLREGMCRWPYGDGPITFCGCSCEESEPYCDGHAAIAFQPKIEKKKRKEAA